MTYRLLLWFDMLEEQGRSTTIRGLFSRVPPLSRDLSMYDDYGDDINGDGDGDGDGFGDGLGPNDQGSGSGNGNGNRFGYTGGGGNGFGYIKIVAVKI